MTLNFSSPKLSNFPILKTFDQIDKSNNENLIKFNTGNELAIELFSKNRINFAQIINIIDKSLSINVDLFSITIFIPPCTRDVWVHFAIMG